jgi:hypothetical protein
MAEQPQEPTNTREIQAAAPELVYGRQGITLRTFDELHRFANYVVKSNFAPKGMTKVEDAMAAIQLGAEVGLSPMSALQRIAVINGRPTVWGDALLGICQRFNRFDHGAFRESLEGKEYEDTYTAICFVKRIGSEAGVESRYSVADAKKANLWGKQGTWTTNPKRMLKYRARAFALRDAFADVVTGLYDRDEMLDADMHEARVVSARDATDAEIADRLRRKPTTKQEGAMAVQEPLPESTATAPGAQPAAESPAQAAPAPPAASDAAIGKASSLYMAVDAGYKRLTNEQKVDFRKNFGIQFITAIASWSQMSANDALDAIEAKLAEATT